MTVDITTHDMDSHSTPTSSRHSINKATEEYSFIHSFCVRTVFSSGAEQTAAKELPGDSVFVYVERQSV